MSKPKVLVTASNAGAVSSLLPVVKQLDLEGRVETVVVAADAAEENKLFEGQVANYKPLSYYGKISGIEFLSKENPSLLLTGTASPTNQYTSPMERMSVAFAKDGGVTSVGVLDQWSEYDTRFRNENGEAVFFPDVLAVMDQIAAEGLIAAGYDKNKLRITGNPNFDANAELAKEKTKHRKEVREAIAVPQSVALITYIGDKKNFFDSYGTGYYDNDCVRVLCEGIARTHKHIMKNIVLLLRRHPGDPDVASWQGVVYEATSKVPIRTANDYKNTKLVCLASDLVVSPASSLLNDSTMMGIDCISIQPNPKKPQDVLLAKLDIIPHSFDAEEGSELVRKVLTDGMPAHYRERRASFKAEPGATGRVVDLIYKTLGI